MNKKLYIIIIIIIAICGITGLISSKGYNFLDALFYTIVMFAGGYSDPTDSILINIARFGALAVTATTLLVIFKNIFNYLYDSYLSTRKDSIFVYGDNCFSEEFIKSSKSHIINRDNYFPAERYVLLDSDEANISFINTNKIALDKKNVYVKSSVFSNMIINDGYLRFFSLEEIFSKKYWKEYPLLEKAFDKNNKPVKELNVVVIGFDKLGEEILRKGTVINIFSPKQTIKYHLFGNVSMFNATHKNLSQLNIKCYEDSFEKHCGLLNKADRIIYIATEKDLNNVNDLIGFLDKGQIHMILDCDIDSILFVNHKYRLNESVEIKTIDWLNSICTEDNIINQKDIYAAKKMNATYSGSMNLCDEKWEKLDTFTKYSNIASVDYYNLTIVKLLEKLSGKTYSNISENDFDNYIEMLSELEHIRWCNYHWFCNWKYGKQTNKQKKTHNCLIPYHDLSREEKDKDSDQIRFMRKHNFAE